MIFNCNYKNNTFLESHLALNVNIVKLENLYFNLKRIIFQLSVAVMQLRIH